ncbi:hypothetical protein UA08_08661 [Talaromyces atroroseus]|uniref:LysM domain-containing protein n=1 Tax=Talaromyces atroroseus TaxID=1441469 RepID=A0A225AGG4_TALAT|nr:hypothetical protein UA08_08661 [Talaromyces atroroseus]OKL56098.1 hypothetical protein UA08_08661 [Talaromyces atroroseus]
MKFLSLLVLPAVRAYLVAPPGVAAPGTTEDCSEWVAYSDDLNCPIIEADYGLTPSQFETWNPVVMELGSTCTLIGGLDYCVQINFGGSSTSSSTASSTASATSSTTTSSSIATTTTSTATTFSTTTSGDGISTPTPYQTGMASNCDKFYLVQSGDECGTIASSEGISLDDFYAWNPAVGTNCSALDLGDYVCVDIIGVTPSVTTTTAASTTATAATTTTSGDGITTPTPYQTGMASDCDKFYLVESGDECGTIASDEGITLDEFYDWNPAVGTNCSSLDLGYYVCVDVIGVTASATTTATTTTSGDGITTPTPHQTGMVSDCDKFYLVQSGDNCYSIAEDNGISLDDFYDWNPAVGTGCASLDLGDYVCVDVVGVTPSATTTTATATTTAAGDGITTPTPYQTGMVTDCDEFYLVKSGDSCDTIATDYDISLDEFYDWNPAVGTECYYLDLGYYVCVGISS